MNIKYHEYGFSEENEGVIKSKTEGIEDKTINGLYSIQQEYRDWRDLIIKHITNEADRTIKTVDEHTTEEVDDAETKILNRVNEAETNVKQEIATKATYVINTLQPTINDTNTKVSTINTNVADIKADQKTQNTTLNSIKTTVESIWKKVQNWVQE